MNIYLLTLDIDLSGIEFSALPSGLHSVDHDVMYINIEK
jgi:hypothetical protein